jgi:DNA-binding IclR family transcriptional regulator
MNEVDDTILEFFEELGEVGGEPVSLPPSPVRHHIVEMLGHLDRERSTFSRRMNKLADRGLLEKTDEEGSYYRITENGLAYLAGELDADDLERDG